MAEAGASCCGEGLRARAAGRPLGSENEKQRAWSAGRFKRFYWLFSEVRT